MKKYTVEVKKSKTVFEATDFCLSGDTVNLSENPSGPAFSLFGAVYLTFALLDLLCQSRTTLVASYNSFFGRDRFG